MNDWATEGGNPFADARWDEAWTTFAVDAGQWDEIREELRAEASRWLEALGSSRTPTAVELCGMIGSVAHLAYHLGAGAPSGTAVRHAAVDLDAVRASNRVAAASFRRRSAGFGPGITEFVPGITEFASVRRAFRRRSADFLPHPADFVRPSPKFSSAGA